MIKEDIIVAKNELEESKVETNIPQHIPRHMRRKFVQRFKLPTFAKQFEAYARSRQK